MALPWSSYASVGLGGSLHGKLRTYQVTPERSKPELSQTGEGGSCRLGEGGREGGSYRLGEGRRAIGWVREGGREDEPVCERVYEGMC